MTTVRSFSAAILFSASTLLVLGCRRGPAVPGDAGAHQQLARSSEDRHNDSRVGFPVSSDPGHLARPATGASSSSSSTPEPGFTPDAKLGAAAGTLALDAVDLARDSFGQTLDWTDGSISQVERILDRMYRKRAAEKPSPDAIARVERTFGSYVGEVFRRNHGAAWGMITLADDTFPGLESSAGQRFWPWGRVQRRLTNGAEDNVSDYYRALVRDEIPRR